MNLSGRFYFWFGVFFLNLLYLIWLVFIEDDLRTIRNSSASGITGRDSAFAVSEFVDQLCAVVVLVEGDPLEVDIIDEHL